MASMGCRSPWDRYNIRHHADIKHGPPRALGRALVISEEEPQSTNPSVYVISLPRRFDRQAHIQAQLAGIHFSYSFDVRAAMQQRGVRCGLDLFPWKIASQNSWWNRYVKQGEIDCFLSHLECWEDAARCGSTPFHIFLEDDAILPVGGLSQLLESVARIGEVDANWDLLYFGREPLGPDLGQIHEAFVAPGYSYCTFAYALSRTGIAKILRYDPRSVVMPIDEFLPATYIDHPRQDVGSRIRPSVHAYATSPDLVSEASKARFGSDTEDSPEVSAWGTAMVIAGRS